MIAYVWHGVNFFYLLQNNWFIKGMYRINRKCDRIISQHYVLVQYIFVESILKFEMIFSDTYFLSVLYAKKVPFGLNIMLRIFEVVSSLRFVSS